MPPPSARPVAPLVAEIIGGDWDASELCEKFGISLRCLSNYQKRGLPFRRIRGVRRYNPAKTRAFFQELWAEREQDVA